MASSTPWNECQQIQICSSQWSSEEQQKADSIAKSIYPEINIVNIPPGLDQREGSAGILDFLMDAVSQLDVISQLNTRANTNLVPE